MMWLTKRNMTYGLNIKLKFFNRKVYIEVPVEMSESTEQIVTSVNSLTQNLNQNRDHTLGSKLNQQEVNRQRLVRFLESTVFAPNERSKTNNNKLTNNKTTNKVSFSKSPTNNNKLNNKITRTTRKSYNMIQICSNNYKYNSKGIEQPVLTLKELVEKALELREGNAYIYHETAQQLKPKYDRINPLLASLVSYMLETGFTNPFGLNLEFSDIKPRTMRKYLKQLVDLKWLIKVGMFYKINPFLEALIRINGQYRLLFEYATFKIDFFDLLNLPLLNLLEMRKRNRRTYQVKDVDVGFYEFPLGSQSVGTRAVFCGLVIITLKLANGSTVRAILPLNLHGRTIFKKKHERELLKEYCIPLRYSSVFDILECQLWSDWSEEAQETVFVHFDNSIKVLHYPDLQRRIMFTKPLQKAIKNWQGYEYVEFNNFDTLKKLFDARFVKNKRRLALFEELGLKFVKYERKKRKTKTTASNQQNN